MHASTLLHEPDDHLVRILAAVTPDLVRSERPDDTAPIRMQVPNGSPRLPQIRLVSRQIRHLHALGLVERNGDAWTRTAAGDACLAGREVT